MSTTTISLPRPFILIKEWLASAFMPRSCRLPLLIGLQRIDRQPVTASCTIEVAAGASFAGLSPMGRCRGETDDPFTYLVVVRGCSRGGELRSPLARSGASAARRGAAGGHLRRSVRRGSDAGGKDHRLCRRLRNV